MKKFILSILGCLMCWMAVGQQSFVERLNASNLLKGGLYLKISDDTVEYINDDGHLRHLNKPHKFGLKKKEATIYTNWLNPLKYAISWEDSTWQDPEVAQVKELFVQIASLYKNTSNVLGDSDYELFQAMPLVEELIASNSNKSYIPNVGVANDTLNIYKNIDLLEWELNYKFKNYKVFRADQKAVMDNLEKELKKLDQLYIINYADSMRDILERMLLVTESEVSNESGTYKALKVKYAFLKEKLGKLAETSSATQKSLEQVKKEAYFGYYTKAKLGRFLVKVNAELPIITSVLQKIESLDQKLKESVKIEPNLKNGIAFRHRKHLALRNGKLLWVKLKIVSYELSKETHNYVVKGKPREFKLEFFRREPIRILSGAGVFYASRSLQAFGTSVNDQGELVIEQQELEKNTAIPAVSLNMYFNVGSENFAPVIQLGADPFKKRPFLLTGAGFAIPSRTFVITGGAMWTWVPSLKNLTVGDVVPSTLELEKDIEYNFKPEQVGWYIGVQMNFDLSSKQSK